MSLKTFHVLFIVGSILLCLGFGYWSIKAYADQEGGAYLWWTIGSFALAAVLTIYEVIVVKKVGA